VEPIAIRKWVDQSPDDRPFRQAVHTILTANAGTPDLQTATVMKGGVLPALRYRSQRHTRDIDFSTNMPSEKGKRLGRLIHGTSGLGHAIGGRATAIVCRGGDLLETYLLVIRNCAYPEQTPIRRATSACHGWRSDNLRNDDATLSITIPMIVRPLSQYSAPEDNIGNR